jgi:predicted transcriptional regulator
LQNVVERILATTEQDFIVADNQQIQGVLYMADLASSLKKTGKNTPVRYVMDTDFIILRPYDPLHSAYRKLRRDNRNFFPVMENGRLVGVMDLNNINEFLAFRSSFDY